MIKKIKRLINGIKKIRKSDGNCCFITCGSQCCKLDYACFFLKKSGGCKIYLLRPFNCRIFPNGEKDKVLCSKCTCKFSDSL